MGTNLSDASTFFKDRGNNATNRYQTPNHGNDQSRVRSRCGIVPPGEDSTTAIRATEN